MHPHRSCRLARPALVTAVAAAAVVLPTTARGSLTVEWVARPIPKVAIDADPTGFLQTAQSWSLLATNTDGHWASAGMRAGLPTGYTFYNTAVGRGGINTHPNPAFFPVFPDLEFDTYVSSPRNQQGANPPSILGPFPEDAPHPTSFGGASDPLPGVLSVAWGDAAATSGPGPGTYEILRLTFRRGLIPSLDPHSLTSQVTPDQTILPFGLLPPSPPETRWLPDADGAWHVAGNWSAGVPGTGPDGKVYVLIDVGGPTVRTITHSEGNHAVATVQSQEHLAISGGSLKIAVHARLANGLTMTGGTLSGSDVLRVNGELSIAGASALDLIDGSLINDYAGDTPLSDIRAHIISGYNNGSWNGAGINSTTAAGDATLGVGYGEASALFTSFPAFYMSEPIDQTTVLVRLTPTGDANLDGTVNLTDFNRLAANFGSTSALWDQGDFTYDGIVNLADFNALAGNFGLSAGADGVVGPDDWANLAAAVPEPAGTLSILAVVAVSGGRRRRGSPRGCSTA